MGDARESLHWNAEAIWEAVAPGLPGFSVEILPEVDSTNSELMRRARGGRCEPGLLVAERQTAGRGRMGRDWQSDTSGRTGSLTFSLGMVLEPQSWSGLSLVAGLSVAQALHPELRLKWPNDLWWRDRKLGGILIETASFGPLRYVVVGVGINIAPVHPPGLATPAAALQELRPDVDAPQALGAVVPPLVAALQEFAVHGFGVYQAAFSQRDALSGREVFTSDGTAGVARGVDATGALLVHTAAGVIHVSSAEVSVRPAPAGTSLL